MYALKATVTAIVMLPALVAVCVWAELTGKETAGFVS
jgi:hypothetical protein